MKNPRTKSLKILINIRFYDLNGVHKNQNIRRNIKFHSTLSVFSIFFFFDKLYNLKAFPISFAVCVCLSNIRNIQPAFM